MGVLNIQTKCPNCKTEEWRKIDLATLGHPEVPVRSPRFKLEGALWYFKAYDAAAETVWKAIHELNAIGRQDATNCAVVTLFGEAAFLSATPADILKNRKLIEKYNVVIGEWLGWGGAQ